MKDQIDRNKLFGDDCRLLQQKLVIARQAARRPRASVNFIPWEPYRP